MGITSPDVKILFLDDDFIPSRKYVEKCFTGDYDIMQESSTQIELMIPVIHM